MKFRARVVFLAVLVLVAFAASASYGAAYWKSVQERFPALLVAGEAITIGQPVCIAAADGKVYKADANSSTRRPAIGLAERGTASAANCSIVTRGVLAGISATQTKGAYAFLSETAGGVTYTAPTDAQSLGYGVTASIMRVSIGTTLSDLTALADGYIWVGDGSALPVAVVPSGDVAMSNLGAFTISAIAGACTFGGGSGGSGATISTAGAGTFDALLSANGGIAVDTSAFTVADTTGNTLIAGSLAANGGITCDSTAFTVANTSGDVATTGTLAVTGLSTLGFVKGASATVIVNTDESETVTAAQSGAIITFDGAGTLTLPDASAATVGCRYTAIQTANTALTVTATTAASNSFVCDGNATADNVTITTSAHLIGAGMTIVGISATQWYVGALNPEAVLTPVDL